MANASAAQAAYQRYGRALIRKADRMLRDRDEAVDAVHELFLELWQKEQEVYDLPYLYRMLTHRCLNRIRNDRNRAQLIIQNEAMFPRQSQATIPSMDRQLLEQLVRKLDEKCQRVLVYHFLDELSQEEIAQLEGVSRKTVGKRLQRVRACLQSLAAQENRCA